MHIKMFIHERREVMKKKTWGDVLGIIGLVFGIVALVVGLLALIPLIGLVLAVVCGILAIVALGLGIAGVIKAVGKGKCITAIVFGALMLVWAIVRYYWVVALLASAAAAA